MPCIYRTKNLIKLKAIILNKTGEINFLKDNLTIQEVKDLLPGKDEVLIKIHYAALNHRDLWITKGLYSGIKFPIILGSDCAGVIDKIGDEVAGFKKGDEVIINPGSNWGDNENFQSSKFNILGLPENGTLSQYITVPASKVYPKPEHLSLSESAAIPLAGLTAYRAVLVKANIKSGENVLITGIGGGVATFAFLFSKAMGANIFVTSGSNEKIKTAKQLGAFEGFNYQNEMWDEVLINILNNKIDAAIDGTGGDVISKIMNVVKPGGRIVNYGATKGNANNFDMRKLFWKQFVLYGTTMGSDKDFKDMISFINKYKIKPMIDNIYEFEDYINAFLRMNNSEQFGKIIIKI